MDSEETEELIKIRKKWQNFFLKIIEKLQIYHVCFIDELNRLFCLNTTILIRNLLVSRGGIGTGWDLKEHKA